MAYISKKAAGKDSNTPSVTSIREHFLVAKGHSKSTLDYFL